jgi:hypothetical protein
MTEYQAQFSMDEEEEWTALELGKEETLTALGALRVAGPSALERGQGYVFVAACPEGMKRTITVETSEAWPPMFSFFVRPQPAFTREDVEETMSAVVYRHVEDSLGELPILVFDTAPERFGVHISGTTRTDVALCIVGMLARMVTLDHAQFVRHYGLAAEL